MNAAALYAASQGIRCEGLEECHFCGNKCGRLWTFYPPPRIIGIKDMSGAARPSSCFLCHGCSLWRARRRTIRWLHDDSYKDGQCAINHSWLVTSVGAFAINPVTLAVLRNDSPIYRWLLRPTQAFFLALTDGKTENQIHRAVVNNLYEVKPHTSFAYTFCNVRYEYTPYDLRFGMDSRLEAKHEMPGVRLLLSLFGQPDPPPPPPKPKKGQRDHPTDKPLKETLVASGQFAMV